MSKRDRNAATVLRPYRTVTHFAPPLLDLMTRSESPRCDTAWDGERFTASGKPRKAGKCKKQKDEHKPREARCVLKTLSELVYKHGSH